MNRIKISGLYRITHRPTGKYYVGMSTSIFDRWASHYNDIKMKKHSSIDLVNLWNISQPEDWVFEIIEYISLTDFKKSSGLKGKVLETSFRRHLLKREKYHMSLHSINLALNKNNKSFS